MSILCPQPAPGLAVVATDSRVDFDKLNLLDRLALHIPRYSDQTYRFLFSRSGFTDRLIRHAADPATGTDQLSLDPGVGGVSPAADAGRAIPM